MIEREKKRERLINKYGKKRIEIKQLLKGAESYEAKLALYAKLEKLPNNSAPSISILIRSNFVTLCSFIKLSKVSTSHLIIS